MGWMPYLENPQNSFGLKFDDEDDELFLWNGYPTKSVISTRNHCQITILDLLHSASRIWTCADLCPGFVEWSGAVVITATPRCRLAFKHTCCKKQDKNALSAGELLLFEQNNIALIYIIIPHIKIVLLSKWIFHKKIYFIYCMIALHKKISILSGFSWIK